MKSRSHTWLFLVLAVVLPFTVYATYSWYASNVERLPVFGKEEMVDGRLEQHRIDDFMLTNQDGQSTTADAWTGRIMIADFFFTHCPTICPRMTNSLKQVQQSFGRDAIGIASFTVDPERDSAARLKWYAAKFAIDTSSWQLLTGSKKDIYRLARNSFMVVATDGDGGPLDFIHSEKLVLVDRSRHIRGYYDGTNRREVEQLIKDINKLKHEK